MYTRKAKRGGVFGFGNKAKNTATTNLKAKRNYNMKHSKSRVANVLGVPGQVRYTNKERIEGEYQKAIEELKKLEQPAESASALKTISEKIKKALESQEARETGAIVITIPVGVAQLFLKVARVMLAAFVFLFVDLPSMGTIPMSASVFPNSNFQTTTNMYNDARRFTGAR
jgi:antitoxin component HigA of HigAB toxin-antitoxin module